jgi:hypothetical protein
MVMCLARSHTQGAIFDAPEFADSIRPFSPVIYVRKTAYKANHMRPNKWVTLFFSGGYAFPVPYAVNVGLWVCLQAVSSESGLLATFGEALRTAT